MIFKVLFIWLSKQLFYHPIDLYNPTITEVFKVLPTFILPQPWSKLVEAKFENIVKLKNGSAFQISFSPRYPQYQC